MTATAYIVLARIAGGSRLSLSVHIKRRHASYVYKAHLLFYSNSIVLGGFEVKS